MLASEVISKTIYPLNPNDGMDDILTMLAMNRLKELPVVQDGHLIGIVSEETAYEMTDDQKINEILVDAKVIQVLPETHIFELISKMAQHNMTMVPVADKNEKYLGLVTQEEVFKYYAQSFAFKEPGSIIVLDIARRSYSLVEISQIVESEGAAILSCFLSDNTDIEHVNVTLKINKQNIQSIIAGFERYSYTIVASYTEQEYLDDLKERYDLLMHYLNV